MMIRSVCNNCLQPFNILLGPDDARLMMEISIEDHGQLCKCPRLCGGKINLAADPSIAIMADRLKEPLTITGKELYVAVHGLGLPDEIVKDPAVIRSLLQANRVSDVTLEEVAGRLYLHELRLDNGTTLHLAAGARGAQLLKVTKDKKS